MRIARLDLLRFGKFTDCSVALPQAPRDFHLIVGPNEAGKSTLRSAILDLLFGIETRTRFNFLHAHGDMRLGALVEDEDKNLDFVRVKARTKTLQSRTGAVLPDNALFPFLGAVDRGFFDKMFGLDHERLVAGGREILDASKDLGRILFQSAAGIGSLGAVRDKLEAEADSLWAKRKSGERQYYAASDELERAEAALKQATVRTKDWVAARALVDKLEEERDAARAQYRQLEQKRVRLDRIRRVAPLLAALQDRERELLELGEVTLLPPDAGKRLSEAELAMAKSNQALKLFSEQTGELDDRIGKLHPDAAMLSRQADIQALADQRQQVRNHPGDIGKRQEEVTGHWKAIEKHARELGWPVEGEGALEERIPSMLIRSAMAALIRRHDIFAQTLATARDAKAAKLSEIEVLDGELNALPTTGVTPGLRDALAAARALGDIPAQERRLAFQVAKAQQELDVAIPALAPWQSDIDNLRRLPLPTAEEMVVLQRRQTDLAVAAANLVERIAEQESEIRALELDISQYQAVHHPVSLIELTQVRGLRDELWLRIKAGAIALPVVALDYESRVADADGLSDRRHDKAREVSELQAKQDQKARLDLQLSESLARQVQNNKALADFNQDWEARASTMGLAGMAIAQVGSWRTARERVLHAADTLAEARQNQTDGQEAIANVRAALAKELQGIVDGVEDQPLNSLILRADEAVNSANRAHEGRVTLTKQKARAERALADSIDKLLQAQADLDAWRDDWAQRLAMAHLPPGMDTGSVEGALTLFSQIDDHLRQMSELRTARIDAMQRDLDDFGGKATELARAIAPELLGQEADHVTRVLSIQLAEAAEADKELQRLKKEREDVLKQSAKAETLIQQAQAELAPLLNLARVTSNDELRSAIERSERAHTLGAELGRILQALQDAGDGLARASLEAEFATADLAHIPVDLTELQAQVDELLERQNRNAAELNSAQEALGKIAGQDEAARAESQRQDALARMANAAERYIKVRTAAKLLRWAIERYRETKQGPMLGRAGDIFASLTLGAFSRLAVDFESEPMTLYGRRTSGEHVGIEGLSDGTRDQLYLALRLAALEMHLQQAPAMPFIADDLVINYDDARAKAGLESLAGLSEKTQVIFLTHHDHLIPVAESVFGKGLNVVRMG